MGCHWGLTEVLSPCHWTSAPGMLSSLTISPLWILRLSSTKWYKSVLQWQHPYHRTYRLIYLDFIHGPIPAVLPFDNLFQIPSRFSVGTPLWKNSRNARELSWQPLDIIFKMPYGCGVQIYHNCILIWEVSWYLNNRILVNWSIFNYMNPSNIPGGKILRICSWGLHYWWLLVLFTWS